MGKVVVLGLFVMVGIVAGAYLISSVGREKPQEQDLTPVNTRIDSITGKVDSLERRIADLNERLEQSLIAIQENSASVGELKGRLAPAGKGPVVAAAEDSEEKKLEKLAKLAHDGPTLLLDEIKEAVKKEIKEENKIAKKQQGVQGAKKWVEWQTQQMRKKLDNDFVGLVEKIGLDRNQEIAIRDITEGVLRQLKTLWTDWEERLADANDEVWGEFKGEIGGVYENAQQQLLQHVSEEQARAVMRFVREDGK